MTLYTDIIEWAKANPEAASALVDGMAMVVPVPSAKDHDTGVEYKFFPDNRLDTPTEPS